MRLVIAEKPSVAQSIAAVLGAKSRHDGYLEGGGYIVSWCFGHLAELADAAVYNADDAKWTLAALPIIPAPFRFIIRSDKQNQFDILRELMRRVDMTEVVNACDAGREGELIFRTVYCLAGCTKPILRLWISSMEDDAIRSGFQQLKSGREYDGLHQSALCRAKADWLVGINATRYFSLTYGRTLNIGRVMSPTLALLVQREAEISAFVAEPFYTVQLDCGFPAAADRMKDRKDADAIANACKGKTAVVKSVERKEKSEKAPALYDLTALHIVGQEAAVGARVGTELLFIERLEIVEGLLGGVAENTVGVALEGGQIVERGRFLGLFLAPHAFDDYCLALAGVGDGIGILSVLHSVCRGGKAAIELDGAERFCHKCGELYPIISIRTRRQEPCVRNGPPI